MLGYLQYVYAKRGEIAVATTYYLVLVTFLTAYIHPARAVTVTIDTYNEAELELAFMLLSLPAAARFILDSLKKHPKAMPAPADAMVSGAPRLSDLTIDPSILEQPLAHMDAYRNRQHMIRLRTRASEIITLTDEKYGFSHPPQQNDEKWLSAYN